MKKFLIIFGFLVIATSCSITLKKDARKQTNEKLQVSGIFGIRNKLTMSITGHKIFDNIRITHWENIPYDTISYNKIYDLKSYQVGIKMIANTISLVNAENEYKETAKFGNLYTSQELNKLKSEWEDCLTKDSLYKNEYKRLRSLYEEKIDIDKPAYIIHQFEVCATSLVNNKEECYENGYSFVNYETNIVDTFLILGEDLHLYSTTENYQNFLNELPLVNQ